MLALQYGYFGTKCLNVEPEEAAGAAPQPGAAGPSEAGNIAHFLEYGSHTASESHSPQAVLKATFRLEWNVISEVSNVRFFGHTFIFKGLWGVQVA